MDNDVVAVTGFGVLFLLMALRVPVGIAMGLVGLGGFAAVSGITPALNLMAMSPIRTVTDHSLALIPMFILMGSFATATGLSRELFQATNAWFGRQRGGLAMGTITACGGFAAICGSSVATAATMTKIALPEMRKAGYSDALATGVIAAGGTLGILIPPSIVLAIYGFITDQDVAKLFIAGVIPGILAISLHLVAIKIISILKPGSVPEGKSSTWEEKTRSLRNIWAVVLLFVAIIGGIYSGIVTPTEAAAMGAFFTFLIGLVRRRLDLKTTGLCLIDALRTSVTIFTILIGALLFGYFLTITQTPQQVTEYLIGLPFGPYGILLVILLFYFVLGCVLDAMAMIILTVPILFPVVTALGFDPIWFGIIVVMTVELGLITPPVGLNVFVINSVARDVSLVTIFKGVMPFVLADIVRLAILIAIPALVLFLPERMA